MLATILAACKKNKTTHIETVINDKSIYFYKVEGINGDTIDFAKFKGKKILMVNTASECMYTYQYEGLEQLYQAYKDKLVIVGFPSNDFGMQEPGTNQQISDFCKVNYGVTFPLAAKVAVKGDSIAPVYKWLTSKDLNGYASSSVDWNFQKYLIDQQGKLVGVFESGTAPNDPGLIKEIEK